jgi:hypothetical protein
MPRTEPLDGAFADPMGTPAFIMPAPTPAPAAPAAAAPLTPAVVLPVVPVLPDGVDPLLRP